MEAAPPTAWQRLLDYIQKALNTPYPAQYFAFDYDKMAGSGALKILGNTYRFEARTEAAAREGCAREAVSRTVLHRILQDAKVHRARQAELGRLAAIYSNTTTLPNMDVIFPGYSMNSSGTTNSTSLNGAGMAPQTTSGSSYNGPPPNIPSLLIQAPDNAVSRLQDFIVDIYGSGSTIFDEIEFAQPRAGMPWSLILRGREYISTEVFNDKELGRESAARAALEKGALAALLSDVPVPEHIHAAALDLVAKFTHPGGLFEMPAPSTSRGSAMEDGRQSPYRSSRDRDRDRGDDSDGHYSRRRERSRSRDAGSHRRSRSMSRSRQRSSRSPDRQHTRRRSRSRSRRIRSPEERRRVASPSEGSSSPERSDRRRRRSMSRSNGKRRRSRSRSRSRRPSRRAESEDDEESEESGMEESDRQLRRHQRQQEQQQQQQPFSGNHWSPSNMGGPNSHQSPHAVMHQEQNSFNTIFDEATQGRHQLMHSLASRPQYYGSPVNHLPTAGTVDINSEISPALDFLLDTVDGNEPNSEAQKRIGSLLKKLDPSNREKLGILRKACAASRTIKTVQAALSNAQEGGPQTSEMVLLPRLWVEEVLKLLQEQVGGSKGKEKETGDASNDAQRSVA